MKQELNHVAYEKLYLLGITALINAGTSREDAETTVRVLLRADLRGVSSHGIQRLIAYVSRIKEGLINPKPKIEVKTLADAIKIVFGDDGLGPVVASRVMKTAIELAKKTGISMVGCRDSNHFGAAAPYSLMACDNDLIGITLTNAFPTMAPTGGLENIVGNNPLSIGIPFGDKPPFLLDIAMSMSSRGRIRGLADKGEKIPYGWATDLNGNSTNDPMEALKGFVLPIAAHKGYGLAVAIDILCGVLTGAGFGVGVKSLFQQWDEPQHIGHVCIAIDPSKFMDSGLFLERMSQLYHMIRNAKRINPDVPIYLPGDIEFALEEERKINGIPIPSEALKNLESLAMGHYNVSVPRY